MSQPSTPAPRAVVTRPQRTEKPPKPSLPEPSFPEPTPQPGFSGGPSVQASKPQELLGEEQGFPIKLAVDEQVALNSVSAPVLTFRLERVSLSAARFQQRELFLEGSCDEKGRRKRCPHVTWIRISDEEGQTPKTTGRSEANNGTGPSFDFTASVPASSRRFLITVGDPESPDVRWLFDAQEQTLKVAH